ncbi:MAG: 16S rRNA (guanine(527)-N(7))-methyltransferase RsmG [Deltaproteobacteria bacterium]|nr:16S rRNA (guanine(527)-N(7))-methyltransferase RsmG [Deltaproteobacteria bacterium]
MGRSLNSQPMDLLQEGAAILGLQLPYPVLDQFRIYLEELQRWNARVNLTGLKTDQDIVIKHFLDSLAVLPYLGDAASLADLGSGAGFPGLALKLIRPALTLTLVEARAKKAAFLQYLISLLKLEGVEVAQVHLTTSMAANWGPRFDAVITRAAFPLVRFLELAAPLLLPGGRALALKGPNLAEPELDAARKRCPSLGLGSLELQHYLLPLIGEPRLLVLARRN